MPVIDKPGIGDRSDFGTGIFGIGMKVQSIEGATDKEYCILGRFNLEFTRS
jgi:hypothetical protein